MISSTGWIPYWNILIPKKPLDAVLGLERLRAIHLNDSMTPFSSFKDRHETIGKGSLGEQAFINIINHPVLRELPFFLETPRDDAGHGEEITWLKEHYRN